MEPAHIATRAVFAYLVLLLLVRASGKRVVAEGTPFDFVLALVLGDMVDDILWGEAGAAKFVVAAGTLALAHTVLAWAQATSPAVARVVNLEPSLLVCDGTLVPSTLRAERLSEADVEALLRLQGLDRERWSEVAAARLEEDGLSSVLLKPEARSVQRKDVTKLRRP
jgi:uncharacterized membrane protein YcaP (DUF421 family)